jgi:hypothetical protein
MFEILMAIGCVVLAAILFSIVLFMHYGQDWNR